MHTHIVPKLRFDISHPNALSLHGVFALYKLIIGLANIFFMHIRMVDISSATMQQKCWTIFLMRG